MLSNESLFEQNTFYTEGDNAEHFKIQGNTSYNFLH